MVFDRFIILNFVFVELHSDAERILNVDPDFKTLLSDCLKEPKSSSAADLLQVNILNNTIACFQRKN